MEVPGPDRYPSDILVDTGDEGGARLSPEQWRDWKASHGDIPSTLVAYFMPGAGLVVGEEAWAEKLAFGNLLITDVPVTEANQTDAAFNADGAQATLGITALKRLELIVDGDGGNAYLRAREGYAAPYDHNRLGAVFTPLDLQKEELIAHVMEGSPGWEAGIRNGDVLTRIGELDVTRWRTDPAVLPFSRFFNRAPGTKLELVLRRFNETFTTTVVLRQILAPRTMAAIRVQRE
jgi:hypothetical protein